MKIKSDDYEKLKAAVTGVLEEHGDYTDAYKGGGLSPMRFRWDLLWTSKLRIGDGAGAPGDVDIYAYANDAHIDTALRQIMREAGIDWAAAK